MSDDKDFRTRQKDLVARIYGGALNPSGYIDIFRSWDRHYESLGSVDKRLHESDFTWAEEWIEHFERSGQMLDMLESAQNLPLAARIENGPDLEFAVDASGRIIVMSECAAATLGCVANTSVADLAFDLPSHTLIEAMRRTLTNTDGPFSKRDGLLRLFADEGAGNPLILLAETVTDRATDVRLIRVRTANPGWRSRVGDMLKTSFDLTSAETEVVRQLYIGKSVKEIAMSTGRSQATLRTQLSSVLQKVGVKGQTGLARTVAGLIAVLDDQDKTKGFAKAGTAFRLDHHQIERTLNMSTGERINVVESGDLDGDPFFFIQTTTWPTLTPDIARALAQNRIRLVSPYRSGVGRTTQVPPSFTPSDWASRFIEAIDALGFDRVRVGGMCSGGIHALELARALGSRCRSVLLLDTGAPLLNARMINQMPFAPRRLFLAARYFPRVLKTPYKLVTTDFYSGEEGRARGVQYFVDGSPLDSEAVKDPALWRIVRDNVDYCLRNPQAAVQDVVHWSQDYTELLKDVLSVCPVRYLHGADNLVHRADHIASLVESRTDCTARLMEGESQLLLYRRPEVFAGEIKAMQ